MTQNLPSASTTAPRPNSDLEAVVALVSRLSVITNEATRSANDAGRLANDAARLALEIHAKLPRALETQLATGITWIRGVPLTPAHWETAITDNMGELCADADKQTMGVPNGYREKKKTRKEALGFYRDQFDASVAFDNLVSAAAAANTTVPPGTNMGVQKWTEHPTAGAVDVPSASSTAKKMIIDPNPLCGVQTHGHMVAAYRTGSVVVRVDWNLGGLEMASCVMKIGDQGFEEVAICEAADVFDRTKPNSAYLMALSERLFSSIALLSKIPESQLILYGKAKTYLIAASAASSSSSEESSSSSEESATSS
ncbi:hypothetical protein R3P38DRAFT_2785083 [Favolaschia claudopus]|uniref:Uncharacterized protein n=1 Tax=Favolaschia claudopus TaxID=2862362 RepID=A0AAW0AW18_9AGAR